MLQAFTEFQARQSREQVVRDEALRLVSLVGAAQRDIVAGAEQLLTILGAAPSVQGNDRDHCHRLLHNLLSLAPRYASIAVTGLDGRRRCEPTPNGPDADLSDRPYFRQALQTNEFVVGEHTGDPLSVRPGIPMAQPFRDQTGQVAGVVVLELSLDWLATELGRLPLPEGASAAIMDRDGRTLASLAEPGSLAGLSQEDYRIPHNSTGTGIAPSLSVDGHSRMMAYAWVGPEGRNLLVTVELDAAATFAPIYQARPTCC